MTVWAIGDLHLSFGVPDKKMDVFGDNWASHEEKIKSHWNALISPEDLILIPGDISWAKSLDAALPDLKWIDALPGTKVIIRGNHDYWWSSLAKVRQALPASLHAIQNDSFNWNGISIAGARLWETEEYHFNAWASVSLPPPAPEELAVQRKIYARELERLKLSLSMLDSHARIKIAMTHYPPIGGDLKPSAASALIERHHVDICVFGHLHALKKGMHLFGKRNKTLYLLTSCDFIDFKPLKVVD